MTTPIITSAMGGQPGTLITGLLTSFEMGVAPVGLGLAACTQPLEAQLPQATMAAASAATVCRIDSAVLPPTMQYTPPSLVGTAPFHQDNVLALVVLDGVVQALFRLEAGSGHQRLGIIQAEHVEQRIHHDGVRGADKRLTAAGALLKVHPDHGRLFLFLKG